MHDSILTSVDALRRDIQVENLAVQDFIRSLNPGGQIDNGARAQNEDRKGFKRSNRKKLKHGRGLPDEPMARGSVDVDILALCRKMDKVHQALEALSHEGFQNVADLAILQSLLFQEKNTRQMSVPAAHTSTLSWVLDDSNSALHKPEGKFVRWLNDEFQGHEIFWISGKPGSGKSTLMKYLYYHNDTRRILQTWVGGHNSNGGRKLVMGAHFFWNGGSDLQRSQTGLFRALLFDVLRECPELMPNICPRRYSSHSSRLFEAEPWTRAELLECFNRLKSHTEYCLCLFIDGLDEYHCPVEGSHDNLARTMQTLASGSTWKLCLSSRPWNEFAELYGRGPDQE